MRNVEVIKVYNLVDINGNKLQLRLGVLKNRTGEVCISNGDKGYRWSFVGKRIPMPVRSMYWFNGFEDNIMLDWLKANGWCLRSLVFMDDGSAQVYELPDAEPSKGNETYELPAHAIRLGELALNKAVKMLYNNGEKIDAASLYRYVHPTCMYAANDAVKAIVFDNQQ